MAQHLTTTGMPALTSGRQEILLSKACQRWPVVRKTSYYHRHASAGQRWARHQLSQACQRWPVVGKTFYWHKLASVAGKTFYCHKHTTRYPSTAPIPMISYDRPRQNERTKLTANVSSVVLLSLGNKKLSVNFRFARVCKV